MSILKSKNIDKTTGLTLIPLGIYFAAFKDEEVCDMDEKKAGKQPYVEPKVVATYRKEDLEEIIKTQGQVAPSPTQVNGQFD